MPGRSHRMQGERAYATKDYRHHRSRSDDDVIVIRRNQETHQRLACPRDTKCKLTLIVRLFVAFVDTQILLMVYACTYNMQAVHVYSCQAVWIVECPVPVSCSSHVKSAAGRRRSDASCGSPLLYNCTSLGGNCYACKFMLCCRMHGSVESQ